MSNNNGSHSAHGTPPGDLVREGQHVQELIEKIETLHAPAARAMLQECIESVLSFYGHGLARILELIEKTGDEKVRDALSRVVDMLSGEQLPRIC
jgi:hypothetical protein